MTRFTVLGVKIDQCAQCGQVCPHVVGRKTRWAGMFWLPLVLLGFTHGMACSTCHTWTGIPWRQVRVATKTGMLPLDRSRPNALELLAAAAPPDQPPLSPTAVFDRLQVNPKRGPWDLYLKAYPVLIALMVGFGMLAPGLSHRTAPGLASPASTLPPSSGTPHTCWRDDDGSISGCRLDNGTIEGFSTGQETTCYFSEPLGSQTSLRCRR
jgi:hypothetical protein